MLCNKIVEHFLLVFVDYYLLSLIHCPPNAADKKGLLSFYVYFCVDMISFIEHSVIAFIPLNYERYVVIF